MTNIYTVINNISAARYALSVLIVDSKESDLSKHYALSDALTDASGIAMGIEGGVIRSSIDAFADFGKNGFDLSPKEDKNGR